MTTLVHARGELALDRCLVMGIVNRTPDSFYDGGRMALSDSVAFSLDLLDQGADILDVGAMRAGPGPEVDEDQEIARLLPLLEAIVARTDVPVSVETSRASVARAAIDAGACIVNDVSGLGDPQLPDECARSGAALVLMHHGEQLRGRPLHPRYPDVVESVLTAWRALIDRAFAAGVSRSSIVVDPGLDFGKTAFHSLELIRRLDELVAPGWPVLVAPSRKDVVGESLDLPPDERLEGTLALVALSAYHRVSIVRVHDVRAAVRTVAMVEAVLGTRAPAAPLRGLWD